MRTSTVLLAADLIGVAVFAASGAAAGVAKRLDIFGVVFVGFVAALGGGVFRDLVIDVVPPLAFADWRYSVTAAAASGLVFFFHRYLALARRSVLLLDAAGLGLFTAAGALKALAVGVPPVGAVILGMITGVGGGLLRDLLTAEIPVVLRREIYALASLLGAVAVVLGIRSGVGDLPVLVAAATLTCAVRMLALYRGWSAPTAAPNHPTFRDLG